MLLSIFCARFSRVLWRLCFFGARNDVMRPCPPALLLAKSTSQAGSHPPFSGSKLPYVPSRIASFRITLAMRLEIAGDLHRSSCNCGSLATINWGFNASTPCSESFRRADRKRGFFAAVEKNALDSDMKCRSLAESLCCWWVEEGRGWYERACVVCRVLPLLSWRRRSTVDARPAPSGTLNVERGVELTARRKRVTRLPERLVHSHP